MPRLIDADALKEYMGCADAVKYGNKTAEQQHNSYSTIMMYEVADYISDMPTIDAVEVVRCKNCTSSNVCPAMPSGYLHCDIWDSVVWECGYCHHGAKMDGGAKK